MRNNTVYEESLLRSAKKVPNIDAAFSNASLVNELMNGASNDEQHKIQTLLLESTHNDLDVINFNEHTQIHESNCSRNENEELDQDDDESGFNFVHKTDITDIQTQKAKNSNKNIQKNKSHTNNNSKSNRIANNMSPISIITLSSDSDEPERDVNGFAEGLETVSNQN